MIFLSYSHSDKHIVNPIAEKLRGAFGEDKVFFDAWSIQPGDSIIQKMDEGLAECRWGFFFVSKNSLKSKMVALEWRNLLMKSMKEDAKLIPVKLDDCSMPCVLLEKLYVNLNAYGFDVSVRQIVDVIMGDNTYKPGSFDEFQNITALVLFSHKKIKIEFRAEVYLEPQSKYLILLENTENEVDCCCAEGGLFHKGFKPKVTLNNGKSFSAFQIGRSEATSPGFPFIVEVVAKSDTPIKFVGVMRAKSHKEFITIPHSLQGIEE